MKKRLLTQKIKIKDLGKVITGTTPPTANKGYFGGQYLFIKPSDISEDQRYVFKTEMTLSGAGYEYQQLKALPKNSICIVCIGTIGKKMCLTSQTCFTNQQLNSIVVNESKYDPLYIYYLMRMYVPYLKQLNAGSTSGRENVNKSSFQNIEIQVHELQTQPKIAFILSAYDDLIENNTRRIKILEEMAQTLYHEWFVKFRFPGYEQVKMVESGLSLIPERWDGRKVTDAIWVNPKTQVVKEGEKPFVPMGCLSNDSMLINNIESRSGNSGSKFKNGDTLFARITPCLENGKTGYVQFLPSHDAVAFGSTEFIVLRSKTLCPQYVYLMARSDAFRDNAIKSMTGATGRQRVQEACFDKFLFAHPDDVTMKKFSELISPFFKEIYVLAQKNNNLRQTRDLLLPKLISGEIDVENLDIDNLDIAA
ncbi:MAG: restriction endonuclease subunit S [Nostoc sp.]|uniref:restriction endonuclease subunit S n=1 Tax=Nostoc sp. TaxID=1180 RepID=UPI002FF66B98